MGIWGWRISNIGGKLIASKMLALLNVLLYSFWHTTMSLEYLSTRTRSKRTPNAWSDSLNFYFPSKVMLLFCSWEPASPFSLVAFKRIYLLAGIVMFISIAYQARLNHAPSVTTRPTFVAPESASPQTLSSSRQLVVVWGLWIVIVRHLRFTYGSRTIIWYRACIKYVSKPSR